MNQLAQDLRAAKALIDTPEKWTQRSYARDSNGKTVSDWDERATCFCSKGAVWRTALLRFEFGEPVHDYKRSAAMDAVLLQAAGEAVIGFNDSHTHEEVMAVWDKAIEIAEAQS